MKTVSEQTARMIVDLYASYSLRDVAKRVGENPNTVKDVLVGAGVAIRKRGRPRLNKPVGGEVVLDDEDIADAQQCCFEW